MGAALYHAIQLQLDYPSNKFALESAANALCLIALLKKRRHLGEYVSVYSTNQPKDYGKFLQVLWETSASECGCLAYKFNSRENDPYSPERHLATKAIAAYSIGDLEEAQTVAEKYSQDFPKGHQIDEMKYLLKLQ